MTIAVSKCSNVSMQFYCTNILCTYLINPNNFFQTVEWSGIKFPEARSTGVWLRSQRMKMPPGVGQRKTKAIEQELRLMNIGKIFLSTGALPLCCDDR